MIVRRVCCDLAFELGRSVPGEIRLTGYLLLNSLPRLTRLILIGGDFLDWDHYLRFHLRIVSRHGVGQKRFTS